MQCSAVYMYYVHCTSHSWLCSKYEDSGKDPKIRGHSRLTLGVELCGLTFSMTLELSKVSQHNKHDDDVGSASDFLLGLAKSKV